MIDPQSEMNRDFAAPRPSDRVMPAEEVFLNGGEGPDYVEAGPDHVEAAPPLVAARRPGPGFSGPGFSGPGFFESIAWMIGMHAVQIGVVVLASALMFAGFVLMVGIDPSRAGPAELMSRLMSVFRDNLVTILGVAQVAMVVYGLLAIRFRLRPHGLRRLGLQLPWLGHWLLVALLMPPLCLSCSVLQNAMFQLMPSSRAGMEAIMDSLAQAPLALLVLVIGLGPALAEELVFRGLIGRGLVARWGLVRGMLVTSVLFGVMHINPAQAIGVIPLGFAMHFVYFTTRSFWAPVTLHLFNNSLSVILLKHGAGSQVDKLVETNSELPIPLLVVSVAMVTTIAILLWQTRVQYVLRDGSVWNPGYISTEAPSPEVDALAKRQGASPLLMAGITLSSLGFVAAVWLFATG